MLRPIALLCCLLSAQAFLLPLPLSSFSSIRLHAAGFGASSKPQFNLRYGELPQEEDPAERLARQKKWEAEYLAYVKVGLWKEDGKEDGRREGGEGGTG